LRQAVLIGATGFLGRAIEACIRKDATCFSSLVIADHRHLMPALLHDSSRSDVPHLDSELAQDWIVATGIVDPRRDPADLLRANVEFPVRLFERLGTGNRPGRRRLVTFGSVLENRSDLATGNPYLESKAQLLQAWKELNGGSPVPWLHLQLHTVYGGSKPPHSFMFMGQMFSALLSQSVFAMSTGEQLREYHHVDDIAESTVALLCRDPVRSRVLNLSSGRPVRLRDLASGVFAHFAAQDLLLVGAKPLAQAEIFESPYCRSPELVAGREPCQGVIRWFESLGIRSAPTTAFAGRGRK
jgi:nucleoside-diphosphate-sugar epimerase